MKDEKGVRHSRNGRLNQARKYADEVIGVLDAMMPLHGGEMFGDAGWAKIRLAAEKVLKCVHEANAYNNAYSEREDVRGRIINLVPEDFDAFNRILEADPTNKLIDLLRGYTVVSQNIQA